MMSLLPESLFGAPPFASETLEELEMKILDTKPVEVNIYNIHVAPSILVLSIKGMKSFPVLYSCMYIMEIIIYIVIHF